jgi:hypothetical protein
MSRVVCLLAGTALSGLLVSAAHSQTIIDNGTVALGVNPEGNLIFGGVGLTFIPTNGEALAPGCDCEGWGATDFGTDFFGKAGESFGDANLFDAMLTVDGVGTFGGSTGSSAVSTVDVGDGSSMLSVMHGFSPAVETENLYRVDVTITNTGTDNIAQLVYRRAMDWDVPPTEFSEFVTIQGLPATKVMFSSDNGFADGNPNVPAGAVNAETVNVNFTDNGPSDHGAVFDFDFGALPVGESISFTIFYGASASEAEALAALAAAGAEIYSLGQPSTLDGDTLGTPNTFIFAFAGVGGTSLGGSGSHGFLNAYRDIASLIMRSHRRIARQFTTVDPGARIAVDQIMSMSQNANVSGADFGRSGLRTYGALNVDFGDFDSFGDNAGFSYNSTGMLLGADYQLPESTIDGVDVVVGGSLGFQAIDLNIDSSAGKLDAEALTGSLYAYGDKPVGGMGQLHGEARAMFTYLWYDQTRVDGGQNFNSNPDGIAFGADVEAGYQFDKMRPFENPNLGVQTGPFVGFGYGYSEVDGFNESNGGLEIASFDDDSLTTTIGGRVTLTKEAPFNTYFAMLEMSYTHDFLADGQQVDTNGGALTSGLSAPDDDLLGLRLVTGMNWGDDIRAMVEYNGVWSKHSDQHSVLGRVDFAF